MLQNRNISKDDHNVLITGGAGFIGSHLAKELIARRFNVVVYDNLSNGRVEFLEPIKSHNHFKLIVGDINDEKLLDRAMNNINWVVHLASNPDIAKSALEPTIDFWQGTVLTQIVLESARKHNVNKITYASGSGIYGIVSGTASEYNTRMIPISPYGASKMAGEGLISAYSAMYGITGLVLRFANVVGNNQTHGVGYDFINKLIKNPYELEIWGDGNQSKSYVYVDDIIKGIIYLSKHNNNDYDVFNLASNDFISVKEIADIVVDEMKLSNVEYKFTGGKCGFLGDVPNIELDLQKVHKTEWKTSYSSRLAIIKSIQGMLKDSGYTNYEPL
jgi:UDP-glucose 4-epimerase